MSRGSWRRLWLVLAIAIVIARSWVYLGWGYSYFDSDQAVFGLIANDIVAGRAFPFCLYGQQYLLPLASWVAAPLFAAFSPSILLLRLPLLLLNIAVIVLLFRLLATESGLSWPAVFASTVCISLPSVVASSRLLEVAATIEQFFWTVVLWVVRRRPLIGGVVAGVGFANREFVGYAVVSLWLIDMAFRSEPWSRWWRRWVVQAGMMLAVVAMVRVVVAVSPDTFGPKSPNAWTLSVDRSVTNLIHVATQNLPALFGASAFPLRRLNVTSELPSALAQAAWPLGLSMLALSLVGGICVAKSFCRHDASQAFPLYLALTGGGAVVGFVLFAPPPLDLMLVRYTLLALLLPVGLLAFLLRPAMPGWARRTAVCVAIVWVGVQAVPNARLLREYIVDPPRDSYGRLAEYLVSHRLTQGDGPYWVSYHMAFRTNGRVVMRNPERTRIVRPPYWFSGDPQFTVDTGPQCADATPVERWWVCSFPRLTRHIGRDGYVTITEGTTAPVRYDARPLRGLLSESTWLALTPAFEGEPGCWLRSAPGARVMWLFQGERAMAVEVVVRRPDPGLTLRLPGPARVHIVDLDTSTVLATVDWKGAPLALWHVPLPNVSHRLGVVVERVGGE